MELSKGIVEALHLMSTTQAGEFTKAYIAFLKGEDYQVEDFAVLVLLTVAKTEINHKVDVNKARAEGGKKGGRPRKQKPQETLKTFEKQGFLEELKEVGLVTDNQCINEEKTLDKQGFSINEKVIVEEEGSLFPSSDSIPNKLLEEEKKGDNKLSPKKESKEYLSYVAPEFVKTFEKWLAYKRERKQTYKSIGMKSCYNNLYKLSEGDPEKADMIVEFTIAQNYQGLVVPREHFKQTAKPQVALDVNTKYNADDYD